MKSDALAVQVERRILLIRGQKVMLDADLAELYGVPTKSLNLALKRNAERFPEDFMFQLTGDEAAGLRFHFETSKSGRGGRRYRPYALPNKVWPCSPACCGVCAPFKSTSPSCAHLCACARCFCRTQIWRASWPRWKTNMTCSSRSCSMPSVN